VVFFGPMQGGACQCTFGAVKFRVFALALFACSGPKREPFSWPRNVEDVRARLLVSIPEGREIEGARQWMGEHGFECEAAMPSATDAHAHLCHGAAGAPADAGWRRWTVVLYERSGRLADVSARR
jgi:hypothetical protein